MGRARSRTNPKPSTARPSTDRRCIGRLSGQNTPRLLRRQSKGARRWTPLAHLISMVSKSRCNEALPATIEKARPGSVARLANARLKQRLMASVACTMP